MRGTHVSFRYGACMVFFPSLPAILCVVKTLTTREGTLWCVWHKVELLSAFRMPRLEGCGQPDVASIMYIRAEQQCCCASGRFGTEQ